MATITLTRGNTLPDSSSKTDFHNLVDSATATVTNIVNADVDAAAAIANSKLNLAAIAQSVAMSSKQFLLAKGADVASATSITLGTDGNYFDITGTTNIQTIAVKQAGSVVILQFDGALTLVDDTGNLELNGSDISVSAEDHVVLVCDGTNWHYVAGTQTVTRNPRALDVVTAEATVADNTTNEETAWTYAVPANTLGTANLLRCRSFYLLNNDSGGNAVFTVNIKYGSTTMESFTVTEADTSNSRGFFIDFCIKGNTATDSQVLMGTSGYTASDIPTAGNLSTSFLYGTAAEDSTGALNLLITFTSDTANATISVVMKYATLELLEAL